MCVVAHLQQRLISLNHQRKILLAAGGRVSECEWVKVAQSCLTLCDPMGLCSPWNSPGQNTEVGSCRKPVWGIQPVTRSWGRKLTYARRAQTSGTPLEIPKHVPQQKSAGFCALLFHSSDIFWKKSIQGFSLLHLKECFNPKNPSDGFLACLQDSASVFVWGLLTAGGTGSLKHPRNVGASEEPKSLE